MQPLMLDTVACVSGFAKCNERSRNHGQTGPALPTAAELVHPGDVCDQWRRPLRGTRLAIQPVEEPEMRRGRMSQDLY